MHFSSSVTILHKNVFSCLARTEIQMVRHWCFAFIIHVMYIFLLFESSPHIANLLQLLSFSANSIVDSVGGGCHHSKYLPSYHFEILIYLLKSWTSKNIYDMYYFQQNHLYRVHQKAFAFVLPNLKRNMQCHMCICCNFFFFFNI